MTSGGGLLTSHPVTAEAAPRVDVRIDGRPLTDAFHRQLGSVRIATRLSQPAQCELAFSTWRDAAPEDPFPLGAQVEVTVTGRGSSPAAPAFEGEVTSVELGYGPEGETVIRIRAYDILHRLRGRQSLRVFEDVTVADLARTLTNDLGLDVVAGEPGPRCDRLVQHAQSDLELLVDLASRAGLYIVLVGRELRFVTLAGAGAAIPLQLGSTLMEARIGANVTGSPNGVRALGWHAQRAEVMDARAGSAQGGAQVDLEVDLGRFGAAEERTIVDLTGRSDDEIAAFAQARLDAGAGRLVTLNGVAEGDTSLRAGTRVEVGGVASDLRGTYVLAEAIHTVDATGFRTAISTEPPAPPRLPQAAGITLGRVCDVDDPDGRGRVRVRLPAYGDADVGWLAVLCPGAGPTKGIVALPDVDDTVLVALPHGSPPDGVVIGSVFGQITPPDCGVVDGRVRRWSMTTPTGHSVVLDDDKRRVRIANSSGSVLDLGPDQVRLHAQTDLLLEAPGRHLTIRAAAVDFAHAPDEEPADLDVQPLEERP